MKKLTNIEFIEKAKRVHGDKYDYSSTNYTNYRADVKVICPIHGEFEQNAHNHLTKHGCPRCKGLSVATKKKMPLVEFIEKAKLIHGDKYNYNLVDYINSQYRVKIVCPIHGEFMQTPNAHLASCGCPKCNQSKGELRIKYYLENLNIKYEEQKKFNNCKYIQALRFDFYLPNHTTCIEYDGRQHFVPIESWGGLISLNETQTRDKIKTNYCIDNGINLIRISYLDNIDEVLDNKLKIN